MQDRIFSAFNSPDSHQLFTQNELIYDQHLSNFIDQYTHSMNSHSYFAELNGQLLKYTQESSKIFSKLKHLSLDLSENMLKMSQNLTELAETLGKFTKMSNDTYTFMKIRQTGEVQASDRKLEEGLGEWGKQVLNQRQLVLDNMGSFFNFKKHEFRTFNLLIQNKIKVDESFKKKFMDLENKKQKLFEGKDVGKWKIPVQSKHSNIAELLSNYSKAKSEMIPDVRLKGNQASR